MTSGRPGTVREQPRWAGHMARDKEDFLGAGIKGLEQGAVWVIFFLTKMEILRHRQKKTN